MVKKNWMRKVKLQREREERIGGDGNREERKLRRKRVSECEILLLWLVGWLMLLRFLLSLFVVTKILSTLLLVEYIFSLNSLYSC
jgi:hypothetical protein